MTSRRCYHSLLYLHNHSRKMCISANRVSLWNPLYSGIEWSVDQPCLLPHTCAQRPYQTYDTFMQPSQTKQRRPVMSALPERPKEVPIPARRTTFPGGILYSQFQFMQGRKILKSQSWSVRQRVVACRSSTGCACVRCNSRHLHLHLKTL